GTLHSIPEPATFFLTAPEEVRKKRIEMRDRGLDYYESKGSSYFNKVDEGYGRLINQPSSIDVDTNHDVDIIGTDMI
ncbi:hypothetical protein ACLBQR_31610, partial [Klebsiella pneumoniae]